MPKQFFAPAPAQQWSARGVASTRLPDLLVLARRLERLAPSSADPERYFVEKSELVHALRKIARGST